MPAARACTRSLEDGPKTVPLFLSPAPPVLCASGPEPCKARRHGRAPAAAVLSPRAPAPRAQPGFRRPVPGPGFPPAAGRPGGKRARLGPDNGGRIRAGGGAAAAASRW